MVPVYPSLGIQRTYTRHKTPIGGDRLWLQVVMITAPPQIGPKLTTKKSHAAGPGACVLCCEDMYGTPAPLPCTVWWVCVLAGLAYLAGLADLIGHLTPALKGSGGFSNTGCTFYEVPTPHPSVQLVSGWLDAIRNPRDFDMRATVYPVPYMPVASGDLRVAGIELCVIAGPAASITPGTKPRTSGSPALCGDCWTTASSWVWWLSFPGGVSGFAVMWSLSMDSTMEIQSDSWEHWMVLWVAAAGDPAPWLAKKSPRSSSR